MDRLKRKVLTALARFQIALALMIFGAAWSLDYWQGWLFWLVFGAATLSITVYLLHHDRALVERRMHAGPTAEPRPQQKLIQSVVIVLLLMVLFVSVLDHRFDWSQVPPSAAIAGDVLVVLGFAVVFVVFRENSFAASIVEVKHGQPVIDTGPYAHVRHPMYSGALLMFAGTPLALGSLWGLLPALLLAAALVWRLIDEERCLAQELPGYTDYQRKVRSRLLPGLW